jgi:hypothetical protein
MNRQIVTRINKRMDHTVKWGRFPLADGFSWISAEILSVDRGAVVRP